MHIPIFEPHLHLRVIHANETALAIEISLSNNRESDHESAQFAD